jgi:succinate dehydrogenase / fumarate reductase iron-sulfur subunit
MVVLDVILGIQAHHATDLAVRWNCKAGRCGSCSAEINGRLRLMCMTRMNSLPEGEPITVSPMRTFPLIKDLVTDVLFNYEKAKTIPAFKPRPREPDGTYRMYQQEVERVQEFRRCIECFRCQDVCHVIRDHSENKPGYAGRGFLFAWQSWRCTHSTRTTDLSSSSNKPASASATSPNAAPRFAPLVFASERTGSSRSRSGP